MDTVWVGVIGLFQGLLGAMVGDGCCLDLSLVLLAIVSLEWVLSGGFWIRVRVFGLCWSTAAIGTSMFLLGECWMVGLVLNGTIGWICIVVSIVK